MFGQNKPPHFSDPNYDAKMLRYKKKQNNSGGNNNLQSEVRLSSKRKKQIIIAVAGGLILYLIFGLITAGLMFFSGNSIKAFSDRTILGNDDFSFEIKADEPIDNEQYNKVTIKTTYILSPEFEDVITGMDENILSANAELNNGELMQLKKLSENGKSSEVILSDKKFVYSDKVHPVFSDAVVEMTFNPIDTSEEPEIIEFTVDNIGRHLPENSAELIEKVEAELSVIEASEKAELAKIELQKEADRLESIEENNREKQEQDEKAAIREETRYQKISSVDGEIRWKVFIEAGAYLQVWGNNDDFLSIDMYDESGRRMDDESTMASDFDFTLSPNSPFNHEVEIVIIYTGSLEYEMQVHR